MNSRMNYIVRMASLICQFDERGTRMKFNHQIESPSAWKQYTQNTCAFEPLAEMIFKRESLVFQGLKTSLPGSNAVFRSGEYFIKFFLPYSSDAECENEYQTECFGLIHAEKMGIRVPKLIANGVCEDRYRFYYIVTSAVKGIPLSSCINSLSLADKRNIGEKIGEISIRLNRPCARFNQRHVCQASNMQRWKAYSEKISVERAKLLELAASKISEECFVHSDLNADNILIDDDYNVWIIDFADAMLAPIMIEKAMLLCDAFQLDRGLMEGYGIKVLNDKLIEELTHGILLHPFGMDIIEDNFLLRECSVDGLFRAIKEHYERKNNLNFSE